MYLLQKCTFNEKCKFLRENQMIITSLGLLKRVGKYI